jgi:hypothetical protein
MVLGKGQGNVDWVFKCWPHLYRGFNNFVSQNATFCKHHISIRFGPFLTSKDDQNS